MIFDKKCTFFEENRKFLGLIKHYAHKLRDPSAEGELWGFLWIVKKLTGDKPDRYYAVCLRNEYIRLSKAESRYLPIEEYLQGAEFAAPDLRLDIAEALQKLTAKENATLRLHYVGGYSIDEISKLCKISRQAANNTKLRGLQKLKENLS